MDFVIVIRRRNKKFKFILKSISFCVNSVKLQFFFIIVVIIIIDLFKNKFCLLLLLILDFSNFSNFQRNLLKYKIKREEDEKM